MTSTRSAAATGLHRAKPDDDNSPDWPLTQCCLFEERYADLLNIKAELAAFEAKPIDDSTDQKHFEISCRLDDAERLVMTTYAARSDFLWKKITLFEDALSDDGDRIDNKKVWMFGCIKADLISLGVGG